MDPVLRGDRVVDTCGQDCCVVHPAVANEGGWTEAVYAIHGIPVSLGVLGLAAIPRSEGVKGDEPIPNGGNGSSIHVLDCFGLHHFDQELKADLHFA